jgi:5'-3' exonuclease
MYYNYYGITNVSKACQDYIEGLYWVLGYYGSHKSVDWTWHYKHQAAPFITDLYKYVERTHSSWKLDENKHLLSKADCGAMSQKEQLFMVLPRESLINIMRENTSDTPPQQHVDTLVRLFRTNNSNLLDMLFPSRISLDMINKEYMWQSKVLFQGFDDKVYASLMGFI